MKVEYMINYKNSIIYKNDLTKILKGWSKMQYN